MLQGHKFLVVGAEHIDRYGHVNYKAVPGMLEPHQDALLSSRKVSFEGIERQFGLKSFVRRLETIYSGELKEGNMCEVMTQLTLGETSMTFVQSVDRDGAPVLRFTMVVVMVDEAGNKTPLPEELRKQLS